MSLEFTPPQDSSTYALYVNGGRIKLYDKVGIAKMAYSIKYARYRRPGGKILQSIDGKWYTLYDIAEGVGYADLPWIKKVGNRYSYSNEGYPKAVQMTRDEYAEWRVTVEKERINKQLQARGIDASVLN